MGRFNVHTVEIEDYKFIMEFDSGGDPDDPFPYVMWIYKAGQPVMHSDGRRQVRKEFKKNFSKVHVRNFCLKFVNNTTYRESIINKI